jgi:hypothetical protein
VTVMPYRSVETNRMQNPNARKYGLMTDADVSRS